MKKSHTCEKDGAHLKISFWNLLINLKTNIYLKNNVAFFKKIKKNTWRYYFTRFTFYFCNKSLDNMIYSS